MDEKKWYVLQTKPRNEKLVLRQIEQKGIEIFAPFMEKIRMWSDRKKKIDVPLFSGYVFIYGQLRLDIIYQIIKRNQCPYK